MAQTIQLQGYCPDRIIYVAQSFLKENNIDCQLQGYFTPTTYVSGIEEVLSDEVVALISGFFSASTIEQELEKIRIERNVLLRESDWTQLSSARLTAEEKIEADNYRSALFDFPTTCDPFAPVFPTKPSFL